MQRTIQNMVGELYTHAYSSRYYNEHAYIATTGYNIKYIILHTCYKFNTVLLLLLLALTVPHATLVTGVGYLAG